MTLLDRVSEPTHPAVLPQRLALESAVADNPGVGTKRTADSRLRPGTGCQHGRGETGDGCTCPFRCHPSKADEPASTETGGRKAPVTRAVPKPVAPRVFVLGADGVPLDPCHPARARRLLACGRARVTRHTPFVICLTDRSAEQSVIHPLIVKIDPGSRHTGMVLTRLDSKGRTHGVFAVQVDHRGRQISEKLSARAGSRRRRRSSNLRYRAPRFDNRNPAACDACGANAVHGKRFCRPCSAAKAPGVGARGSRLAPSLRHRVDGTVSMVSKLARWAPVTSVAMELVRFDLQAIEDPEIAGVGYQQGSLAGYEIREYLLEKYRRTCVYCDATEVPLNIDHVQPRSKSGSDRVSNLVLACVRCNQRKGSRQVEDFLAADPGRLAKVLAGLKKPLRDAASVNATRWALHRELGVMFPGQVSVGSGGLTKYNRTRADLPKSHTLDALCVGKIEAVGSYPSRVALAKATGRGVYQRTKVTLSRVCRNCGAKFTLDKKTWNEPKTGSDKRANKHCPSSREARDLTDHGHRNQSGVRIYSRAKKHHGFITGDLVRAVVPTGKKAGVHVGRVSVRASGSFNIATSNGVVQGVNHRHCVVLQRGDGWGWSSQPEAQPERKRNAA